MNKLTTVYTLLLLLLLTSCYCATDTQPASSGDDTGIDENESPGYFSIQDYDPLIGFSDEQLREHHEINYPNTASYHEAVSGFDVENKQSGEMTQAGLTDFVRRTNYFRAFYQLPPVGYPNNEYNRKAQEAALSMIVENRISHDTTEFTYTNDDVQEAAAKSNLAMAWHSSSVSYTALVDNLVMDIDVPSTGHRNWIFLPGQTGAGYGYLYDREGQWQRDVLVQWVLAFETNTGYDHPILYPPAGVFPIEFVVDSHEQELVDFTLYWQGASFAECTVSIQDHNNDQINATIVRKEQHNQNRMPPAVLVWQPKENPAAEDKWTITISGISGKQEETLTYTISFVEVNLHRSPSRIYLSRR